MLQICFLTIFVYQECQVLEYVCRPVHCVQNIAYQHVCMHPVVNDDAFSRCCRSFAKIIYSKCNMSSTSAALVLLGARDPNAAPGQQFRQCK